MELAAKDAANYGIADGDRVQVRTRRGKITSNIGASTHRIASSHARRWPSTSAVPGYRVRAFALPYGLWPKNRALAARGSSYDRAKNARCPTRTTLYSKCVRRAGPLGSRSTLSSIRWR